MLMMMATRCQNEKEPDTTAAAAISEADTNSILNTTKSQDFTINHMPSVVGSTECKEEEVRKQIDDPKEHHLHQVQRDSADEETSNTSPEKLHHKSPYRNMQSTNIEDNTSGSNHKTIHLLSIPDPPSPTFSVQSTESGHSMAGWAKLRTTVKVAGAVNTAVTKTRKRRKQSGVSRQDSFMKRFTTRYQRNSIPSQDSEDESAAGTLLNKARVTMSTEGKLPAVINPDGNFMFYWLALLTISVLYNMWTCIAREGFPEICTGWYQTVWYTADGICDLIYLIDVCVQLRTGYLERGLIVYSTRKLAKHYVHSKYFIIDLFSLIPLDIAQIYIGIHPLIRFPRFLKAYRAYRFSYMVETRTVYPNMWRVANLSHILFLGSHWFAAFYYMISEAEDFKGAWGYPPPRGVFNSTARKYLKSLYWATLTLTTIGDLPPPEYDHEYVFTIVSYLIGVFVFATIVGQVGNVITNRNASRQEFERLLDGAKAYMRNHNVPVDMQRRVQRWYDYAWSRGRVNGGGDINSLGLLPDKLKTELALHVNLETLKKVTIFQECEPEFLHDLVLKMKAFIFTPGDLICRKGEVAREMFIIADGLLEVISDSGEVLTQMGTGDFFGEIGILNLDGGVNRRTADVRSVGYSELFVLSREDVLCALKDHPEAEAIMKRCAQKRLKELTVHNRRNQQEREAKLAENEQIESPLIEKIAATSMSILARVVQVGKDNTSTEAIYPVSNGPTSLHPQEKESSIFQYKPSALIRKILPKRDGKSNSQSNLDSRSNNNRVTEMKSSLHRRLSKSYSQIDSKCNLLEQGEIQPLLTSPSANDVSSICNQFVSQAQCQNAPLSMYNAQTCDKDNGQIFSFNSAICDSDETGSYDSGHGREVLDSTLSANSIEKARRGDNVTFDCEKERVSRNPQCVIVVTADACEPSTSTTTDTEKMLSKNSVKQYGDSGESMHTSNQPSQCTNPVHQHNKNLPSAMKLNDGVRNALVKNVQFDNPLYRANTSSIEDMVGQYEKIPRYHHMAMRFDGKSSETENPASAVDQVNKRCIHSETQKCFNCLPGANTHPSMPKSFCDSPIHDMADKTSSNGLHHRHTIHGPHSTTKSPHSKRLSRQTSLPNSLLSFSSSGVNPRSATTLSSGYQEEEEEEEVLMLREEADEEDDSEEDRLCEEEEDNSDFITAVQGILRQKLNGCKQKYTGQIQALEADNLIKQDQIQQLESQLENLQMLLKEAQQKLPLKMSKSKAKVKWLDEQPTPYSHGHTGSDITQRERILATQTQAKYSPSVTRTYSLPSVSTHLTPKVYLTNEDNITVEL